MVIITIDTNPPASLGGRIPAHHGYFDSKVFAMNSLGAF